MPQDNPEGLPNRRKFIERVLTTTSAIAVTAALPAAGEQTQAPIPTCPPNTPEGIPQSGGELLSIGEIRSGPDKVLRATITVSDENRSLWIGQPNKLDNQGFNITTCRENEPMRFFAGA